MTVQSQTAKSGPYAGAGTKGPFPVDFRFLENGHLRVIKTDAAGVEQTLVMGADYSVAGAENQAGGSVTLTADLLAGYTLVVLRKVPATQLADYVEGDSFPAESHENALDKLTMIAQQLSEEVDRAAKLPVTSAADAQQLTNNIMRLANSADNIDTVAGSVDSVNTVAENVTDVNTVAANLANVDTVAGSIASVDTVAGSIADVNTAAENIDAIIAAPDEAQAAANSASSAAQTYTDFDKRYLGSKSADPTTDNQGGTLMAGALYWNTTSGAMRVYSGTAWNDVAQGVSFPYQTFSGTGSQTAFTLSGAPGSLGSLEVFISGVRQVPVTNYTLSGATLTFVTPPPSGTNNIFARWVTTQSVTIPAHGSVVGSSVAEQFILPVVSASPLLVKADATKSCFVKTSATTLAIRAGTHVKIGNAYVSFPLQTAVSMPAVLTPGEDYAVFVHPDGTASAVADPYFDPAEAPVPGALKIGGFHYGLVAPGTTPTSGGFSTTGFTNQGGNYPWTQSKVDRIAGINEFSIWDLTHRSKGEQHGFAFDPQTKTWEAIYFCSPDHITNGISRYNTPVASVTVLPIIPLEYGGDGVMTYGRLSAYEALEIVASHGCRLITQEEFASGALGVTEGQSLGGAASTIPATKREPGYTSRIGLEQATGHIWTIGGPLTSVGGSAWIGGPNRGNFYGGAGLPLFGGNRELAANSGSRADSWFDVFWLSRWDVGLRAACDHYQGGI